MSTPDKPLTRRQLREMRNTGATPVIDAQAAAEAASKAAGTGGGPVAPASGDASVSDAQQATAAQAEAAPSASSVTTMTAPASDSDAAPATAVVAPPVAPLPRAAEPVHLSAAPVPDSSVDLGAVPLTRRQARQQERIRTASVPVINPDAVGVAHPTLTVPAETAKPAAPAAQSTTVIEPPSWMPSTDRTGTAATEAEPSQPADPVAELFDVKDDPITEPQHAASDAALPEPPTSDVTPEPSARAVLNPMFGAGVLSQPRQSPRTGPSFEQLLGTDGGTAGSTTAPSALIMSHAPAPLTAPIAGTGEVLVTGTFNLPEGLGSTGHAPGTTDGRDVDAVLVDGELPAHSSPTPIAASAAVSTLKPHQEVSMMAPPAPEKGGKLMLTLAITAGVLALALVGVLVYALTTGVIS